MTRSVPEKKTITHPTRVITLANLLSVLRAFLTLPIIYSLAHNKIVWAVLLIIIAIITDWLDGYYARKAHEVSSIGKILDPVADSIVIAGVALFITLDSSRNFPLWFFIFYVIRQLTITLSGVYSLNHTNVILGANILGKWTVGITSCSILLYIINYIELGFYVLILATILASISWLQYLQRNFSKL